MQLLIVFSVTLIIGLSATMAGVYAQDNSAPRIRSDRKNRRNRKS